MRLHDRRNPKQSGLQKPGHPRLPKRFVPASFQRQRPSNDASDSDLSADTADRLLFHAELHHRHVHQPDDELRHSKSAEQARRTEEPKEQSVQRDHVPDHGEPDRRYSALSDRDHLEPALRSGHTNVGGQPELGPDDQAGTQQLPGLLRLQEGHPAERDEPGLLQGYRQSVPAVLPPVSNHQDH